MTDEQVRQTANLCIQQIACPLAVQDRLHAFQTGALAAVQWLNQNGLLHQPEPEPEPEA